VNNTSFICCTFMLLKFYSMKKVFFLITFSFSSIILFAQNVGIGTLLPKARLHVTDSSVAFSAIGSVIALPGNPPLSGAGRRMMWYSDKAAFRVGYVSGTSWDKVNIGDYSFAAGYNSVALGEYSTAMGYSTNATGTRSTAMGTGTLASGFASTTMGDATEASGSTSTAMGLGTEASGERSIAMGDGTIANGQISTAMGFRTIASGTLSTTMGFFTNANSYASLVIGRYNNYNSSSSFLTWVDTDPLFIIGNGTADSDRSNAIAVLKNGNTGINTDSAEVRMDVNGDAAFRQKAITTISNGINNNIIVGRYSFIKIDNPTGAFTITGVQGGSDGKVLTILNTSTQNMTIANLDAGSNLVNRINTLSGTNITTTGNGCVTMQYSIADNRWMVIAVRD
jgi:Head domain of trimeric autotransporter adhesin